MGACPGNDHSRERYHTGVCAETSWRKLDLRRGKSWRKYPLFTGAGLLKTHTCRMKEKQREELASKRHVSVARAMDRSCPPANHAWKLPKCIWRRALWEIILDEAMRVESYMMRLNHFPR